MQNTVARIVKMVTSRIHADDPLKMHHWLLVEYSVDFKIATLVFTTISFGQPNYKLCSRATRSADQQLLQVPTSRTNTITRAFQICAPAIWDNLPLILRSQPSLLSIKKDKKYNILTLNRA